MPRRPAVPALVVALLLVAVAACGGDDGSSASSTTKATATTKARSGAATTTTEKAGKGSSTTTDPAAPTTQGPGGGKKADQAAEARLLQPGDFGPGWVRSTQGSSALGSTLCNGLVLPSDFTASASVAAVNGTKTGLGGEQLLEFSGDKAAAKWFDAFHEAVDACAKKQGALPVRFASVDGIGDEALRTAPSSSPDQGALDMVVTRSGRRVVVLFTYGDKSYLTDATINAAVDKSST